MPQEMHPQAINNHAREPNQEGTDNAITPSSQAQSEAQQLSSNPKQEPSKPKDSSRETVLKLIRHRARQQHISAAIDVGIIIGAIIALANLFVIADRLSQIETEAVAGSNRIAHVEDQLSKIEDATHRLRGAIEKAEATVTTPTDALRDVSHAFNNFSADIQAIGPLGRKTETSTTQLAIQTATAWMARFGILVCGFFLIQLLVSKYRFDSRLAGQYDAMADALQLMPEDQKLDFTTLLPALTPKLDFGPMPKVMIEHVMEGATRGADVVKKGTSGT